MPASDPDQKTSDTKTVDKAKVSEVQNVPVERLLTMYNEQEKITLNLYNSRVLVSLGVLGFIYHQSEFSYEWRVKLGLTFLFILFSVGNGLGTIASHKTTASVSEALKSAAKDYGDTTNVLLAHHALSLCRMRVYQVLITAIVLIAMWVPNIAHWFL